MAQEGGAGPESTNETATWSVGEPLTSDSAEAVCARLGKKLVKCVSALNQLPSAVDFGYYNSFANFKSSISETKKGKSKDSPSAAVRIRSLVDKIHEQNPPQSSQKGSLKNAKVEEMFDSIVDFSDARLEEVDMLIDEISGKGFSNAALKSIAGAEGKGRGAVRGQMEDLGIPKPQLQFKDSVDNSNTAFVPKQWPKVHAVPGNVMAVSGASHPYAQEIASISYQAHHITPEADPQPPPPMEQTSFQFIDTPETLRRLIAGLASEKEIAIDLEHHSLRSFQGFTCLIQLSTRTHDAILDAIALRGQLHKLLPIFTDPSITKVLHGADSDVKWLQRDFGLFLVNMFDTGQATRVLEMPSYSLAYLLQHYCDQRPDKKYQLADWRLRPLSKEMLEYARSDTHFLLYIYDRLRLQLLEKGGGSDALVRSVLARSNEISQLQYEKELFSESSFRLALKRSHRNLTPLQSELFAVLFRWRDETARALDESTHYVMPLQLCLKLAVTKPLSAQAVINSAKPLVPPVVRERAAEVAGMIAGFSPAAGDVPADGSSKVNAPQRADAAKLTLSFEEAAAPDMDATWDTDDVEVTLDVANIVTGGVTTTVPGPTSLFSGRRVVSSKPLTLREVELTCARIRGEMTSLPKLERLAAAVPEKVTEAKPLREDGERKGEEEDREPQSIRERLAESRKRSREGGEGEKMEVEEGGGGGGGGGEGGGAGEEKRPKKETAAETVPGWRQKLKKAVTGEAGDETGKKKKQPAGGAETDDKPFTAFDYEKAAEEGQGAGGVLAGEVSQFDPHRHLGEGTGKQVRANPRAKGAGKSASFGKGRGK